MGARAQAHERPGARVHAHGWRVAASRDARRRDRRCERGPPQRGGAVSGASGGQAAGLGRLGKVRTCAGMRSWPLRRAMVPARHASGPERSGHEGASGRNGLEWDTDAGGAAGAEWQCAHGLLGPALRGAWQAMANPGAQHTLLRGPRVCVDVRRAGARLHVPAGRASSARRLGPVRDELMQRDLQCACAGRPNEAVVANVPENTGIGQCANHHFTTVMWRPMSLYHPHRKTKHVR